MQIHELLSEDLIHPRNVTRVSPVRVVHRCVSDAIFVALRRSKHHMGRINRVDVVRGEGSILLGFVDRLVVQRIRNSE
jgi:hypothetical protein